MAGKRSRDTVKVRVFIEEMGLGRTPAAAARRAGYSAPSKSAKSLLEDQEIVQQIAEIQFENAKKASFSREDVMKNLEEAFRLARQMDDPQSMIRAMGEVNRMCGYYAPEKKEMVVSGTVIEMQAELQALSKEDLLKLMGETEETPLLEAQPTEEGVFEVPDDDENTEV